MGGGGGGGGGNAKPFFSTSGNCFVRLCDSPRYPVNITFQGVAAKLSYFRVFYVTF